jgi:hypothetical protein
MARTDTTSFQAVSTSACQLFDSESLSFIAECVIRGMPIPPQIALVVAKLRGRTISLSPQQEADR